MGINDVEAIGRLAGASIVFLLLLVGAAALFYLGYLKVGADRPASATAAMSFGFLLVVMLTISQLKHFKGFGVEAETWDQKQIEAARLVDQLKAVSQATSQELALLSANLGLWNNGLTNRELLNLVTKLDATLKATEVDQSQRGVLLAPIYDRISYNFVVDGYQLVYREFQRQYKVPEPNPCQSIQELSAPGGEYRSKLCDIVQNIYARQRADFHSLIAFVDDASALNGRVALSKELRELELDLNHFNDKRTFRR